MGGDHHALTRRGFLRAAGAAGAGATAAVLFPPATALAATLGAGTPGLLRAGASVTDITPGNGGTFFGYVRPDRTANGVAVRLFSRTLVLEVDDRRIAIVTADLGASLDKAAVVDLVSDLGYGMADVVLACTHTHAGPEEWTDWLEAQLAASIRQAHEDLAPARAAWARGEVDGVNQTRSLSAHLANHGIDNPPGGSELSEDPDGPDHPRDLNLRVLRVDRPDGTPVAAWGLFAVHPTNFPNTNTLYSADLSGFAVRRFEASFRAGADSLGATRVAGSRIPMGILANGNQGDLISLYESHNPHACADLMGIRLATRMRELWDQAGAALADAIVLDHRWTRIGFDGQEVEPGKRVADQALWGLPFLGGAKNGPSPFYEGGTEGQRRPEELADPVQGRKIVAGPAPWRNDPELQLVRIGDVLLVAVAGEASTEAGRRITASALEGAPAGVVDAAVVGLANDYVGYFTTPEEYNQQHYEGGHTVFGQYTTLLVMQASRDLSQAMADGAAAPPPAEGRTSPYPPQGGPGGGVGAGAEAGSIVAQPACDVPRMEVATAKWQGGAGGLDRPVGAPFVLVERQVGDAWVPVDSDLGIAMQWSSDEDGVHAVRWEAAPDAPLGAYRFRVTAARYEVTTEPFNVVVNEDLRVLGAEAAADAGTTRVTFRAQHPPPEPTTHLRHRDRSPTGGTLAFTLDGASHSAGWDANEGGWVASLEGDRTGATAEVPVGGLRDGVGNRSGASTSLTLGNVAPAEWPADMAIGGTDRDWHGHTPAEVAAADRADCVAGAPDPGDGATGDGADEADVGAGGAGLPATGGGAVVTGLVGLGLAAVLHDRGERGA